MRPGQPTSKAVTGLLGILSLWPLAYGVWFVAGVMVPTFNGSDDDGVLESGWFLAAHLGTMAISLALIVFYGWHAWTNPRLARDGDARIIWIVAIILVGVLAIPAYWVRWIWGAGRKQSA